MRRALQIFAALAATGLLLLVALVAWNWTNLLNVKDVVTAVFEEPDWTEIDTEDKMIAFIAAHPEQVSLTIRTINPDGTVRDEALAHRPDQPRVLASTFKLVVLSALARAIDEGALTAEQTLSTAAWDSWYLSGTDGDAHGSAYDTLGIPHKGGFAQSATQVTLTQLADAMIRHSDNAATDLLIDTLGPRITAETTELGHPPIHTVLQDFTALFMPDQHVDLSDPAARAALLASPRSNPSFTTQRTALPLSMARGTTATYSTIQAGVATRTWISPSASEFMAARLDWPMALGTNAERFSQFGTKGGSIPGVLTEASYLVPLSGDHAGEVRVGALFLNDLSGSAWLALSSSFAQQGLLVHMLQDDATTARVAATLSAP